MASLDQDFLKPTDPRRPARRRPPSTNPTGTPKSPPPPSSSNRQLPCAGWYWSSTKQKWKECRILEKLNPEMWKFEVAGVAGIFVKNDEDIRFRKPKKKKKKKNLEERVSDSLLEIQKDRMHQSRAFDKRIKKESMETEKRLKMEIEAAEKKFQMQVEAAEKKFEMQVEAVEEKVNLKVLASETQMNNKISIIEKRQQSLTKRQDDLVRQHNEQMARIARRERIRANNKAAMFDLEQKKRQETVDLTRRRSPPRYHDRRRSRDYERMNYSRRRRNQ